MTHVAVDTETSLVSNEEPVPRMVCASLAWGPTEADADLIHQQDRDTEDTLTSIIQDATAEYPAVFMNAPFDGTVISARYPAFEDTWWAALERGAIADVGTQEKMLDTADGIGLKRPYNLGAIASRRAGIQVDKTDPWRLKYVELIDTPICDWPQEARDYPLRDATAPWAIHAAQKLVRYDGIDPLADAANRARAHWAVHLSSLWGIEPDPVAVQALDESLAAKRESLKGELQRLNIARADGSINTKVAQEYAVEAGVKRKSARGVGMAEDDFRAAHVPDDHPLMRMIAYSSAGRERTKMRKAFMRPVIRPRYNEYLETGRFSASNPNTMGIPQKGGYRECLKARPGNVFVAADWSGCQLKCWAHLLVVMFGEDAPSAAMARALREGKDVHGMLGTTLGTDRHTAKGPNFGFIGAMGIDRFIVHVRVQSGVELDRPTAERFKAGWVTQWHPEAFFAWLKEQTELGGDVQQYRSGRLRGSCSYSELALTLIQGMEADIASQVLWQLAVEMYTKPDSALYGAHQVLFIHDENVLECAEEKAPAVADRLVQIMTDVANDWHFHVPAAVDVDIVPRMQSKE